MAKRAPFLAIATDIRKEERVAVTGDVGGYNEYEALGRLVTLWGWCADRKLKDAPPDCDGYAVSESVVRRFLGPRGVEAILGGGCDEFAFGERRPDGLIYLRGTSETVRNLRAHLKTSIAGGLGRAATAGDRVGGRFVSDTTIDQPSTSGLPADNQPEASRQPAVTSVDPRSQIPDPTTREIQIPLPRKRSSGSRDPKPSVPGHQETIACFTACFEAAYGTKPTWDGRRAKQVQNLLRAHGESEVRRRIGILFSGGLAWPAGPYDFDSLVKHFDKLAQAAAPSRVGYQRQLSPLELQLERVAMLEAEEAREKAGPS